MSNLLLVTSSLFGENSKSGLIAKEFVESWHKAHPETNIVTRALTADTVPHLTLATLGAVGTPEADRTPAQKEAVAFADSLIVEIEQAETLVLAAPMYNFSIPSTLKAWIDHIARAGRTFRYTATGPEGLLKGKKVYIVAARGGIYSGDSPSKAYDFQEPYLRAVLGFLGLNDITFIHVEGIAISPESAEAGITRARQSVSGFFPAAVAAE